MSRDLEKSNASKIYVQMRPAVCNTTTGTYTLIRYTHKPYPNIITLIRSQVKTT